MLFQLLLQFEMIMIHKSVLSVLVESLSSYLHSQNNFVSLTVMYVRAVPSYLIRRGQTSC